MARKSPAFSFYPDSWLGGTMRMTPMQRAAYIDLLANQWLDGPFNSACALLVCRGVPKADVEFVLDEKFHFENGLWSNQRLEAEREKQREKSLAGSKGGSKRQANSQAKRKQTFKQNASKPASKIQHSDSDSDSDSISVLDSDSFGVFWSAYPRKTAKGAAERAWSKAVKLANPETIIDAVVVFASSDKGRGDYCPHPATWLNGKCWEDDPSSWNDRRGQVTSFGQRALEGQW